MFGRKLDEMQSLSNDLIRRLLNCREGLPPSYRAKVIDEYGRKLRTSGYELEQTRRILLNGMKGYQTKSVRRMKEGGRIHRTAQESSKGRWKKKLIGKSTWFKGSKNDNGGRVDNMKGGAEVKRGATSTKQLKTRAVIFVEQSPGGELAKQVRVKMQEMEQMLGFKLRVVERTGRNLLTSFPQTRTWSGSKCGREECITCNQEGEELPECTRRSIVYESICTSCNPGATKKGELEEVMRGAPSLYVGESSRSIQERAGEHWGAARRGEDESHMVRHQRQVHQGAPPQFYIKVISSHRTALNRQVKEAIRIKKRGGAGGVLNSKSEFNRCYIPRMVVEEEEESSKKDRLAREQTEREEMVVALEQMDETWEQRKARERELAVKKRGRGTDMEIEGESKPKRRRRMKYPILGEDWGGEEAEEEHGNGEEQEHREVGEQLEGEERHQLCGRNPDRYISSTTLTPSRITDYFAPIKKRRMEFDSDEDWETWAVASSLTGGCEDAPSDQGNNDHASTSVGSMLEKSFEYGEGKEDDSQPMEDDWGDSSGTRDWFLDETEKYVGYSDLRKGSDRESGQSSTTQEAVLPEEEGVQSEVPDMTGPPPTLEVEGSMPAQMCRTTGQTEEGQSLLTKRPPEIPLSEGGVIDKEMTGRDNDITPLSLPGVVMMKYGGEDDNNQGMDDDISGIPAQLSNKQMVVTSVGQGGGNNNNYELGGGDGPSGMDDVFVKNAKYLGMTMTRGRGGDDDIQRQGVMDDIMTQQSLSNNSSSEPSIGQRGGREAVKNITEHISTVVAHVPLKMMSGGGGGMQDNNPCQEEHLADTQSEEVSHPGGQTTNVDIKKPRVLHQMTLTGKKTSTPVRKRTSIASAKMVGGGGQESGTPSRTRPKCSYTKEGVCTEHGEGAKKHEKPVIEMYRDKNGKERRRVKEKIIVYVCDTDLLGNKKLKQSTISFIKKQNDGEGGGDNNSNSGGDLEQNSGSFHTSKVGKSNGQTMKNMIDENVETGSE